MTVDVVRGSSDKPGASNALVSTIRSDRSFDGCLFVGYPIIGTAEGQHRIDALWISPDRGVVVFDLIEGSESGDYAARQDDSANKLDARLRVHRQLVDGRDLTIPIHTVSFGPAAVPAVTSHPLFRAGDDLCRHLAELDWPNATKSSYRQALSVLENVSSIRRSKVRRNAAKPHSRGAKLRAIEGSIATLDRDQNRAVIETVEGVQRIRGLAGSGKTIVLALKAAYLHAQHPDWRIAVTFNTRSLKDMYRRYIEDFHLDQANESPDWEAVRVVNAWGSWQDSQPGLYFEFCDTTGAEPLNFGQAKQRFGQSDAFAGCCEAALASGVPVGVYDAILVDEAQDFPPEFLKLCRSFLKPPGRLVYAYDELQNLERESLPSPETIFGIDAQGEPAVTLRDDGQDIVLRTCYRNPGPLLTTAHALGFGVYRTPPPGKSTGLVQMFDSFDLWAEVGYQVTNGRLEEGKQVSLARTSDSSPGFLSGHSSADDLIQFKVFDSETDQAMWLADEIKRNLTADELRPNDIMVVHPDPYTTRRRVGPARGLLFDAKIPTYLAGVDAHRDVFWPEEPSIVFSTVHRAKGNEAAMVYVIDAHECQSEYNLARLRNRLFAAVTRSKAWVRVAGIGPHMERLAAEYRRIADNGFQLRFRYPTATERNDLRIAHRDRTTAEINKARKDNSNVKTLVEDLKAGQVSLGDLDQDVLGELRALLGDLGDAR